MANKKFSEFVLKTSTSDVSHIVGYNGADNVQITPANFVTGGGTGVFLPLAGGTMVGVTQFNDHTQHGDQVQARFGAGNDLIIEHNGGNSFITDNGTGVLNIQGSTQVNIGGANGTIGFQFVEGANTAMRHNNVTKLVTSSSGIEVTTEIKAKTNGTLFLDNTNNNNPYYLYNSGGNLASLQIGRGTSPGSNVAMAFDNTGFVGIGTTSPSAKMHVDGDNTTASPQKLIKLGSNPQDGNGQYIQFSSSGNDSLGSQIQGTREGVGGSSDLRFITTNTVSSVLERMRIDSAGNTIIQNPTGASQSSYGLRFNKTNSSSLQQDGAEILSAPYGNNTNAGDLIFKTGNSAANLVERVRINGLGELRVVQSSIVVESSGEGIYLGGTTAGNLLNDYEEGTCTLRLTSDTAFDNETDVTCNYTKIGNLVTVFVSANINGSPSGGSGNVKITGLPFTVASTNGFGAVRFGRVNLSASLSPFGGVLQAVQNTTDAIVIFAQNNALSSVLTAAQINSSSSTPLIDGVLTYKV